MRKLIAATALVMCMGIIQAPALAGDFGDDKREMRTTREEIGKMTPEQIKEFFEKKKAEWQKLSKEAKVRIIEKRRAERIKKMDEHWDSMNDDEKIEFVEKRMEKMRKHGFGKHGFKGKHGGPDFHGDKPE